MSKVTPAKVGTSVKLSSIAICTAALLAACSKTPPPEQASQPAAESAPQMTKQDKLNALAKQHSEQSGDVTKWMDQAATKTAAQLAQEEKQAKEALAAREKAAQEAKDKAAQAQAQQAQAAKLVAAAREAAAKPAATTAPQVIAPKPVELPVAQAPAPKPAAPENVVLKVVSSVQPSFPVKAAKAGITEGDVHALVHVEPDGKVSKVDIVRASPKKYFESEVIAAALQWKYAPIAHAQTAALEFHFKLDN